MLLKKNKEVNGKKIVGSKLIIGDEDVTLIRKLEDGGEHKLDANTKNVADLYFGTATTSTGVLPPVVKYISPNLSAFILERPPEYVQVKLNKKTYEIVMPWLLYCVQFNYDSNKVNGSVYNKIDVESVYLFARNTQAFGMGDRLMKAPLPWVDDTGLVDFWGTKDLPSYKKLSIGEALISIKSDVFNQTCKSDMWDEHFEKRQQAEIEDVVEKDYERVMYNDTTPLKMGHIVMRFASSGVDDIKAALEEKDEEYDVFDYFTYLIDQS